MILHLTRLVLGTNWGTSQRDNTRIAAFAIRAGHIRGAVIIAIAFTLIRRTGQFTVFIHNKSGLANTDGLMASCFTFFVTLTDEEGIVARICALTILAALQRLGAFSII